MLVYRLHSVFRIQSIFHENSQYRSILFRQRSESLLRRAHGNRTQVFIYLRVRMTRGTWNIHYYYFHSSALDFNFFFFLCANKFCVSRSHISYMFSYVLSTVDILKNICLHRTCSILQ